MCENKKSVTTKYNGQIYDSRLEAKYAIIFDEMGIEYYYHTETFQLEDGTKYEPDFYLPKYDCWFEVKGVMTEIDEHKVQCLEKESEKRVFVGFEGFKLEDLYKTEYFITDEGFSPEATINKAFEEAVEKAKNFRYESETVEEKSCVDEDALTRLMDLKTSYLNGYYKLDLSDEEPKIVNEVSDTRSSKQYQDTGYRIIITSSQREDFKLTLQLEDNKIFSVSVKESKVQKSCHKIFKIAYDLYSSKEDFHHSKILSDGMNSLAEFLQEAA